VLNWELLRAPRSDEEFETSKVKVAMSTTC
jgi:hypothetical protein